ncbi:hypothetical protein F4811DRAFT_531717 [Daldinia bambusicola]|nr:hypothetical protein F4811DRAFT_531717 [Daldinia bambusicola]
MQNRYELIRYRRYCDRFLPAIIDYRLGPTVLDLYGPAAFAGFMLLGIESTVITPREKKSYFTWLVLKVRSRHSADAVDAGTRDTPRTTFRNFGKGDPFRTADAENAVVVPTVLCYVELSPSVFFSF